jgi:hypothetical protein
MLRGAFTYKIAIGTILFLGLIIVGLIFALNSITDDYNPFMGKEQAPSFKQEKEEALDTESYLDAIEHYKELELDDISQDEAKEENSATLIKQNSEASKSSLSSKIDAIVSDAL